MIRLGAAVELGAFGRAALPALAPPAVAGRPSGRPSSKTGAVDPGRRLGQPVPVGPVTDSPATIRTAGDSGRTRRSRSRSRRTLLLEEGVGEGPCGTIPAAWLVPTSSRCGRDPEPRAKGIPPCCRWAMRGRVCAAPALPMRRRPAKAIRIHPAISGTPAGGARASRPGRGPTRCALPSPAMTGGSFACATSWSATIILSRTGASSIRARGGSSPARRKRPSCCGRPAPTSKATCGENRRRTPAEAAGRETDR